MGGGSNSNNNNQQYSFIKKKEESGNNLINWDNKPNTNVNPSGNTNLLIGNSNNITSGTNLLGNNQNQSNLFNPQTVQMNPSQNTNVNPQDNKIQELSNDIMNMYNTESKLIENNPSSDPNNQQKKNMQSLERVMGGYNAGLNNVMAPNYNNMQKNRAPINQPNMGGMMGQVQPNMSGMMGQPNIGGMGGMMNQPNMGGMMGQPNLGGGLGTVSPNISNNYFMNNPTINNLNYNMNSNSNMGMNMKSQQHSQPITNTKYTETYSHSSTYAPKSTVNRKQQEDAFDGLVHFK